MAEKLQITNGAAIFNVFLQEMQQQISKFEIAFVEKIDILSPPDSIVIRFLLCLLPVLHCQSRVLRFVKENTCSNIGTGYHHHRISLSLKAHFDCGCKKNGQDDSRNSRQNVRGPPPITQNISLKYLYIYMFLYLYIYNYNVRLL